ncbi:hypothetical protein FACS189413_16960 [Bacteroidia bacterium]|nr:hypothetical protein FACS189413_16960 [Bacteroidia bacterium]
MGKDALEIGRTFEELRAIIDRMELKDKLGGGRNQNKYARYSDIIMKQIDTNFDFRTDAGNKDPDAHSPTLRKYHKMMWSKELPNGKIFQLKDDKTNAYLYHESELGEFQLGSDAITHSYKNQKRKQGIVSEIPQEVDELFSAGCTIAAYIIFPNRKITGRNTINQERGCNPKIDDRFDLTLECIRRFYLKQKSPLYDTLLRYKSFFALFQGFQGYVDFFLLQDLVIEDYSQVKFYLPFDDFSTDANSQFHNVNDYLFYQNGVINFINQRKNRMAKMYNNE